MSRFLGLDDGIYRNADCIKHITADGNIQLVSGGEHPVGVDWISFIGAAFPAAPYYRLYRYDWLEPNDGTEPRICWTHHPIVGWWKSGYADNNKGIMVASPIVGDELGEMTIKPWACAVKIPDGTFY